MFPKKSITAMTLVEMMVVVGLGSVVFLVLGSVIVFSSRSFSSLVNYSNLNKTSRMGLDLMTRAIRESKGLVTNTPTSLVFKMDAAGLTNITYSWNKTNKTVTVITRVNGTNSLPITNLTDCTFWTNEVFQRNPVSNSFDNLIPSTFPAQTKLVRLRWICSKGRVNTTNSETVQSMKIVIRKRG